MKTKVCTKCGKEKPINQFYKIKGRKTPNSYCNECKVDQVSKRRLETKIKCVEYKGGKCEKCGYDKYYGALEFHHLEPDKKDFNINRSATLNFEKLKSELDKCILLCANCHRETHGNFV